MQVHCNAKWNSHNHETAWSKHMWYVSEVGLNTMIVVTIEFKKPNRLFRACLLDPVFDHRSSSIEIRQTWATKMRKVTKIATLSALMLMPPANLLSICRSGQGRGSHIGLTFMLAYTFLHWRAEPSQPVPAQQASAWARTQMYSWLNEHLTNSTMDCSSNVNMSTLHS